MINFKYAVFISTFFIFLIEAILHYNVGKNGLHSCKLPNYCDMFKIIGILIIFSMANAFFSKFIFDYNKKGDHNNY